MRTFDRYILSQIFPSLGMTLLVALLILLVERLLRVLDLVLGNSGPLHYVARMLAYLAPHYLGLALPFAFFLTILLTFNRISRESEFDAFLAAGVGLHQLIRPLLLLTFAVFAIVALTFNFLQPHARYAYRALVSTVQNPMLYRTVKEGVFVTRGDLTLLVEKISPDRVTYEKVFIYEDDIEGQSATTTAEKGMLDQQPLGQTSYALLYDGVRLSVPQSIEEKKASVLTFTDLRVSLGSGDLGPFRPRGRDEREFTLFELWKLRDNPPEHIPRLHLVSELNGRLVRMLSILGLPFLAVPLALGRRRSARFYGIALGGGVLLVYHEVLQFGERMINRESEPWLVLWLPLFVFLFISGFAFYRTAFRAGQPQIFQVLEQLADRIAMMREGNRLGNFQR